MEVVLGQIMNCMEDLTLEKTHGVLSAQWKKVDYRIRGRYDSALVVPQDTA